MLLDPDRELLRELAERYHLTSTEVAEYLAGAERDLSGSVRKENLPEMTIRLAVLRITRHGETSQYA